MSSFTNCGGGTPNGKCDHTLKYENGKLSLEIGGCTETISLPAGNLTPAEIAAAVTNVLSTNNPAVTTALTSTITSVFNNLISPTNQELIDAINGAIASGAIVLPKLNCADIQAVFSSVGGSPTGKFLLGTDCKQYSVASIAALAQVSPTQLAALISSNAEVKTALATSVATQLASGEIAIPCAKILACITPGSLDPNVLKPGALPNGVTIAGSQVVGMPTGPASVTATTSVDPATGAITQTINGTAQAPFTPVVPCSKILSCITPGSLDPNVLTAGPLPNGVTVPNSALPPTTNVLSWDIPGALLTSVVNGVTSSIKLDGGGIAIAAGDGFSGLGTTASPLNLVIDPSSTATVTKSPTGLKVDVPPSVVSTVIDPATGAVTQTINGAVQPSFTPIVPCSKIISCLTPGSVPLDALASGPLPSTITVPAANITGPLPANLLPPTTNTLVLDATGKLTSTVDSVVASVTLPTAAPSTATAFAFDAITKVLSIAVDGQATPLTVNLAALDDEGTKLVINGQNLELQNAAGLVLSSTAIGQLDAQQLTGLAGPTGYKLTLSNGGSVTITCADIGQMYPTGTATATTEVLTKDCKSVKVGELPIAPGQLTAGALPSNVTVSGSSINSPITNPLATIPGANIVGPLPASVLPPTTNVNAWTKAAGLTDSVDGIASNIAIPAGTIVETLGYNAAGAPVYQTAAAPVTVTDNANGTVTTNAGPGQIQAAIRPIDEQVVAGVLTAADKFTILNAGTTDHQSVNLVELRRRLQTEIATSEAVSNAPGGVIPATKVVEGVTTPIDTYVDYNGSHAPVVTLPVPVHNGQRLVFNHLAIADTTVAVTNSSMAAPLVVNAAMAGAEWIAINGKWHLTTERPAAAAWDCAKTIACLTPGSIPATALATPAAPSAPVAGAQVFGPGGKVYNLKQDVSATGILLPTWSIVAP